MSDYDVNTMPESFNDADTPSKEDILMNENDILKGLIEAGREKDDASTYEKIQIKRAGKLYFEFRIRPISEEEAVICRERATKYAPRRKGQPKREIDFNPAKSRSWMIYTATVDEDRAKTWDNKAAQEALNVLQGADMIDEVLLAGEKDLIIDRINEISGYSEDFEETAKN